MGWFGPEEQELPYAECADCTKWMVVYEGGAGWRNSASFDDKEGGEGPSCGDELQESPAGERLS